MPISTSDPARGARRLLLLPLAFAISVLAGAGGAAAQVSPQIGPSGEGQTPSALRVQAFTLRHQQVRDALPLVWPLLSSVGDVSVSPGGNTLVVRDTAAAMSRIIPVLQRFDHPAQPVRLEVLLVRASTSPVTSKQGPGIPPDVVARLRKLLPFVGYELLARAEVASQEGRAVSYTAGASYKIEFQLGTIVDDRRLRVGDFTIERLEDRAELLHTNLNLPLDQTLVLGLARDPASPRALMVVVRAHVGAAAEAP